MNAFWQRKSPSRPPLDRLGMKLLVMLEIQLDFATSGKRRRNVLMNALRRELRREDFQKARFHGLFGAEVILIYRSVTREWLLTMLRNACLGFPPWDDLDLRGLRDPSTRGICYQEGCHDFGSKYIFRGPFGFRLRVPRPHLHVVPGSTFNPSPPRWRTPASCNRAHPYVILGCYCSLPPRRDPRQREREQPFWQTSPIDDASRTND